MDNDRNQLIAQRAYALWERAGRPHGSHDEHWKQAEQEMHGLEDMPKSTGEPAHVAPAGRNDNAR